jgi:hypothetical protein
MVGCSFASRQFPEVVTFLYFIYISMQSVVNFLVNKILAKKLQKILDLVLHFYTQQKYVTQTL